MNHDLKQKRISSTNIIRFLIFVLLFGYLFYWHQSNLKVLYDLGVQTDDVRIQLFSFHMYDENPTWVDDPLASQYIHSVPLAYKWVYIALLKFCNLNTATKILQFLCLLSIAIAAMAFKQSRNDHAFALFAFFIFFILHTSYVTRIIVSALPRTFAIPSFVFWIAGFACSNFKYRLVGLAIGIVFYPPIGVVLLGTECIFFVYSWLSSKKERAAKPPFFQLGSLVFCCAILLGTNLISRGEKRHMHTYEQALKNPAFGRGGRIIRSERVPFNNEAHLGVFKKHSLLPLRASGQSLIPPLTPWIQKNQYYFAYALLCAVFLLVVFRKVPIPIGFLSTVSATLFLYGLARVFAFKLYTPVRYPQYGMWIATSVLVFEILVALAKKSFTPRKSVGFSAGLVGLMLLMLIFTGTGMHKDNLGVSFSYGKRQKMYDFIRTLPLETRILQHPNDENSIAFWTARATTITYELLVPWSVERWARNKKRAQQALDALYATSKEKFFQYVDKNEISHVLINRGRFRKDYIKKSRVFSPLSQWIRRRLRKRKLEDLLFHKPPKEAIVFRSRGYLLLDVSKLREVR